MIQTHEEINSVKDREENREQESLEEKWEERSWREDQEEHTRLKAETHRLERRSLELRSLELRNKTPGYDARLRHDVRFPDSVAEDAGAGMPDDRLSLDGDEPPVR